MSKIIRPSFIIVVVGLILAFTALVLIACSRVVCIYYCNGSCGCYSLYSIRSRKAEEKYNETYG